MKIYVTTALIILPLISLVSGCGSTRTGSKTTATQQAPGLQPAKSMVSLNSAQKQKNLPDLKDLNSQNAQTDDTPCKTDGPLPDGVDPDSTADKLHTLGIEKIYSKESLQAVSLIGHAVTLRPDSAVFHTDLATALLQCQMTGAAVAHLEKAFSLAPQNADIAANLAQAYQISGRLTAAQAAYKKAIELNPDNGEIHNNLAVVLIATGDAQEAEKEARKAIFLTPENVDFTINLARM
jgi:Flp pilus assembly protein TadD